MKIIRTLLILTAIAALISACGSSKEVVDETTLTDVELMRYGDEFMEVRKYEEALAAYQYLLDKFPSSDLHIDTQMRMAEVYLKMDHFEEQMELLLRLLRENIIPDKVPEIYCQLGKYYERAAEYNPGITSTDTSDYMEAISYYELALNYEDSDNQLSKSKALYRRGLAEARIGEINKAIEDYRSVTVRFPDQPYSLLAQVKMKDPYNVTELTMDDRSIRSYKEMLGMIAPGEEEETEEPEEEVVVEEQPQDQMDAVIKQAEEEQQLIEVEDVPTEIEAPVEETPQEQQTEEAPAEDQPAEDQPADDSFIETPADTTSN